MISDEIAPRNATRPHDRPFAHRVAYDVTTLLTIVVLSAFCGLRASGHRNLPETGGVLLVSNHLSYLDVFVIGIPLRRRLNYVARSTLFVPVLGWLIRVLGGFPIQREGIGSSGLKETLRRLKRGGVVALFPEGTRSLDGRVAALKPGIAVLATRAGVPIVPAGLAGTFESWPRGQRLPQPYPIRVVYGPPISQDELAGLSNEAVTALLRARIEDCHRLALEGITRDLGLDPS